MRGSEIRPALAIAAAFLAAHALLASALPLIEDEAYYAMWARWPAWGYYDHPPMIAWMIAAGTALLGPTEIGIRLVPILAYTVAGLAVWDAARRVMGATSGIWALVFFNSSLLSLSLGAFATPDAPSVCFWALTLWAAIRADISGHWTWWASAGGLVGLGCLSKFTNAFEAFGLVLWLFLTARGRHWLRSARPFLAIACALAVLAPYLMWNAQRDWVGFERQFSRLQASELLPFGPVEVLLITLVLVSPVIAFLALRGLRPRSPGQALVLFSGGPFLAYLLWHATHAPVAANWQAPLHANIALLAASGAMAVSPALRHIAWSSALALGLAAMAILFKPGTPVFDAHVPPNQYRGWPETRQAFESRLSETDAGWLATADYGVTASLWHHLPNVPVWPLSEPNRYLFRPEFPQALCHRRALLVLRQAELPPELAQSFAEIEPVGRIERRGGTKILFTFYLFRAEALRSAICARSNDR